MKTKAVFRALTAVCCAVLAAGSCGNPWMEKVVDPLFDDGTGPVPVPAFEAFYFDIGGKHYGAGDGALAGTGNINKVTLTVTVIVPGTAALHSLPAPVTAAGPAGAVVSPAGGTDFSGSRTYTVTANGLSRAYTVTVKQAGLIGDGTYAAEDELRARIAGASPGETLILAGTFPVRSGPNSIFIDKAITILAPPGGTLTFKQESVSLFYGKVFEVRAGGSLTLGGAGSGSMVFEGQASYSEPFVSILKDGFFTMNEGVTMQNNTTHSAMAAALEIRGTAVINGGTITNCSANKGGDSAPIYLGSSDGGITGASLTINGGLITGNFGVNSGGSIMLRDDANHFLEWNGGTITNNIPNHYTPPDGYGSIYIQDEFPFDIPNHTHDIDLHGNTAD
ncbi:MAG: hypothetical protein LBO80_05015 [Treponema sp.]|jgi:hypothetical protein|nr:hypothetical protein [Treponema sp.]